VLIMHDVDGYTDQEIAAALGFPAGTVNTWLRAARLDFKAAVQRLIASERRSEAASKAILPLLTPAALLDPEREIPPLPDGILERVWQQIERSPEAQETPASENGEARRVARVRALRRIIGRVLPYLLGVATPSPWNVLHPPAVLRPAPVSEQINRAPLPASAPTNPAPSMTTSAAPSARASAPLTTPATPAVSAAPLSIAAERLLMSRATAALASGNPSEALAALGEHSRRCHGGGRLAEEREETWITALLQAGRTGEAGERLARFEHAFPGNARIEAFRAAVSSAP
jgi:hypothetical protein